MSPFKIMSTDVFPIWQLEGIGSHLLRDEDKRELESLNDVDSGLALVKSVMDSEKAWVAFGRDCGKCVAVFGYASIIAVPGKIIWMVGTDQLNQYIAGFLHVSKLILDNWLEKFGVLHNYIDIRNRSHVNWLTSLDFVLPAGITVEMKDGTPFQYFIKEK
jgi:hypothetical protein